MKPELQIQQKMCQLKNAVGIEYQILAKRGTDWKFKAEANHKLLVPKSKSSSLLIYQICIRTNAKFYPASNYLVYYYAYTYTDLCMHHFEKLFKIRACLYNSAKHEPWIVKAEFCISNSNFIHSWLLPRFALVLDPNNWQISIFSE